MPDTEQEKVNVLFALRKMEIIKSQLDLAAIGKCSSGNYNFSIRLLFHLLEEAEDVAVHTNIRVMQIEGDAMLGEVEVRTQFDIGNWKEVVNSDNQFPKEIMDILNGISISTSRGIVFTLFQNAKLPDVFLPIIDPTALEIDP